MARKRLNPGICSACLGLGSLSAVALVVYLRWYDRHLRLEIGNLVRRLVKGYAIND